MATTKAVSANPYRTYDSATVLHAGTVSGDNVTNSLGLNEVTQRTVGNKVVEQTGVQKANSSGNFAKESNDVVAKLLTSTLAGQSLPALKSGAADFGDSADQFKEYQRLDITSWDYVTGSPTFGANRGVSVLQTDTALSTGVEDDALAVPAELTYMVTGKLATNNTYDN